MANIATETHEAPATAGIELKYIALAELVESPTNPRQRFDAKRLRELADSIKLHGLTHPLRVRPLDNGSPNGSSAKFEIISGHRRSRAAKILKLAEIACNVGAMTDAQVRETQMIELEQSEGVHPLDLAEGYRRLIDAGDDVPRIVARIGKGIAWVYQTLKLCDLIPEAKKLFLDNTITYSHAINIAPYTPAAQKQILAAVFIDKWDKPGKPGAPGVNLRSVRSLKKWIDENLMIDLNKAPFSTADAMLVEDARACTTCPKRTGFKPELFPEIKQKDTCTDPACYQAKVKAFIQIEAEEIKKQDGIPPLLISTDYQAPYGTKAPAGVTFRQKYEPLAEREKPCPAARKAIIVGGQFELAGGKRTGHTVTVCASQSCPVHHPAGSDSNSDVARHQARQKKEKAQLEIYRRIRGAVLDSICNQTVYRVSHKTPLARAEHNLIAIQTFRRQMHDVQAAIYKRHGWQPVKKQYTTEYDGAAFEKIVGKLDDAHLAAFQLEMALIGETQVQAYATPASQKTMPAPLATVAKRFGVNPNAIAREVTAAAASKSKPKGKGSHASAKNPKAKKTVAAVTPSRAPRPVAKAKAPAKRTGNKNPAVKRPKVHTPVKKKKAGKKSK